MRYETVKLFGVPRIETIYVSDVDDPSIERPMFIAYKQVKGIEPAAAAKNRSALTRTRRFVSSCLGDTDQVDLPLPQAERLTDLFSSLKGEHDLQCHDLVDQITLTDDNDTGLAVWEPLKEDAKIESGRIYGVILNRTPEQEGTLRVSHTGIGTKKR